MHFSPAKFPRVQQCAGRKKMFAIPSWLSNSLHVNGGGREKKKKKIPSPEMEREDRGNPSQQVRYIEGNNDPKEEEEGNSDDKAPREDQLFCVVVVVPWSMAHTGVGTYTQFCN